MAHQQPITESERSTIFSPFLYCRTSAKMQAASRQSVNHAVWRTHVCPKVLWKKNSFLPCVARGLRLQFPVVVWIYDVVVVVTFADNKFGISFAVSCKYKGIVQLLMAITVFCAMTWK